MVTSSYSDPGPCGILDKPHAGCPNLGNRPEPSGNAMKSWETARNVVGHTDSEGFNGRWLPQLLLVAVNGALPSHRAPTRWWAPTWRDLVLPSHRKALARGLPMGRRSTVLRDQEELREPSIIESFRISMSHNIPGGFPAFRSVSRRFWPISQFCPGSVRFVQDPTGSRIRIA